MTLLPSGMGSYSSSELLSFEDIGFTFGFSTEFSIGVSVFGSYVVAFVVVGMGEFFFFYFFEDATPKKKTNATKSKYEGGTIDVK